MPFTHRIDSIDFLRGLSILAVILLHINIHIPFDKNFIGQQLSPAVYKVFFWSGYYGVIIFFVISGFLITTASIKRWGSLSKITIDKFYLIRFARIMPCLIALLIILSIFQEVGVKGFIIDTEKTSLMQVVFSALTFTFNWLEAKIGYLPAAWSVLWSLSVEEAFYLFFPIICRWVKNDRNFILLMLVFVILGPFARTVMTTNDIWIDHSYLSCTDAIAIGCIAGLLASRINFSNLQLNLLKYFGLALALLILLFRKQVYDWGLTHLGLNVTILAVGISLLLIALYQRAIITTPRRKWLAIPFQWFGRNSYEVYLTHMFIVIFATQIFYAAKQPLDFLPVWYIAIILLSGICGEIVSRYYSMPMNKGLRLTFSNRVHSDSQ